MYLDFYAQIGIKPAGLGLHVILCYSVDMGDTKHKLMAECARHLKAKVDEAGAFIRPEVMATPDSQLAAFMPADSSPAHTSAGPGADTWSCSRTIRVSWQNL